MFTNLWYNESAASSNSNFELDLNRNKEAIYKKIRLLHAGISKGSLAVFFEEILTLKSKCGTNLTIGSGGALSILPWEKIQYFPMADS
jgi:hypothetical protein